MLGMVLRDSSPFVLDLFSNATFLETFSWRQVTPK